jgi:hypothetical protein
VEVLKGLLKGQIKAGSVIRGESRTFSEFLQDSVNLANNRYSFRWFRVFDLITGMAASLSRMRLSRRQSLKMRKGALPLYPLSKRLGSAWCLFGVYFLEARERTSETYETIETSLKRKKINDFILK